MDQNTAKFDPVQLVQNLDADEIRRRIDAIDSEREALLVLLRAAQRNDRRKQQGARHG
jgi:hypothetical protein